MTEELQSLLESFVNPDFLFQDVFVPAEIEQVADDAFAAEDFAVDDLQVFGKILERRHLGKRFILLSRDEPLHATSDGSLWIVNLVSDAGR